MHDAHRPQTQRIYDDLEPKYTSSHLFIWAVYGDIYLFTIEASRSRLRVMCIKDGAQGYHSRHLLWRIIWEVVLRTDVSASFPTLLIPDNYITDLILLSPGAKGSTGRRRSSRIRLFRKEMYVCVLAILTITQLNEQFSNKFAEWYDETSGI